MSDNGTLNSIYSIYDSNTGRVVLNLSCKPTTAEETIEKLIEQGQQVALFEGFVDDLTSYIVNGEVFDNKEFSIIYSNNSFTNVPEGTNIWCRGTSVTMDSSMTLNVPSQYTDDVEFIFTHPQYNKLAITVTIEGT